MKKHSLPSQAVFYIMPSSVKLSLASQALDDLNLPDT
jgi:hypothetical protein